MTSMNADDDFFVRSAAPPAEPWTPSTDDLLAWADTMSRRPQVRRRVPLSFAGRARAVTALVVVLLAMALGPPLFAFAPRHVHNVQTGPTVPTITGPRSDTIEPSTPTGVGVTSRASRSVTIVWAAATDNVRVAGYIMIRDGVQVGTTYEPSFTDTGLRSATTYLYTVTAFDDTGNISGPSAPVAVRTLDAEDTLAPTPPSNLTVAGRTATAISLTWSLARDNVGVAGYDVFRNGRWIATVWRPAFTDIGLTPATSYSYRVTAFDATYNTSGFSRSLTATTTAVAPMPTQTPPRQVLPVPSPSDDPVDPTPSESDPVPTATPPPTTTTDPPTATTDPPPMTTEPPPTTTEPPPTTTEPPPTTTEPLMTDAGAPATTLELSEVSVTDVRREDG